MDSPGFMSLLIVLAAGYICRWYLGLAKSRARVPFPPGPKPKPLVGNVFELPTRAAWITYTKWAETYGSNILHAEVLGHHIFILSSLEDVTEIMERRASIYSSRPFLPILELMGLGCNAGILPHGDLWRRHRRIYQQCFKKDAVALYEPIQTRRVRQMLKGLLESPDNFRGHVQTVAADIIMDIVYGHNSAMNTRLVLMAEEIAERVAKAILPGAFLVNIIHALRHIPPWFPGAKFHQVAARVKELSDQMQSTGYEFVRKNMKDGTGGPSLLGSLLEASDANGGSAEYEAILNGVASTSYAAGADTTVSSVMTFFYAMAINPDVQQKAQEEIDTVIGNERLPEPRDRPSLRYVEALFREVMRWRPVFPLGVPHTSTDDDIHKGFFVPKGSIIFANIWAMTHDENVYNDPDTFQPERHFDDQGRLSKNDKILAFGFGRRICAGRHLANPTVWLVIANVLATLNIAKAKDTQGNDIEIAGDYTDGAISHPCPFPCSVTPRSRKSRELIESDE